MPGYQGVTMIPAAVDCKLAKTEKNRLRLIMHQQEATDDEEFPIKEARIDKSFSNKFTIPRYRSKAKSENVDRRRPVSLHDPGDEILFGNAISSGTWRPASHLRERAHSAEPTTRQQELQPQLMTQDSRLHPSTHFDCADCSFDKRRDSNVIILDSEVSINSMNTLLGTAVNSASGMQGQQRLEAKLDLVYSLLNMLGSSEGREDMSAILLSMSNSMESCEVMRQSGCLPLLIQLIHTSNQDSEIRERASRALYNIVHAKNVEKFSRREVRVLRFLEQLRDYCQALRHSLKVKLPVNDIEKHPSATIAALMKLSFDESHRHAMCHLGGLHSIAELVEIDHAAHGSSSDDSNCITLRRYSGMALTNLTFGDGNNKALLCSFREFMKALVYQLGSSNDDLRQVTASVLRNLSWRADNSSKQTLREVGAVVALMKAAMEGRKESTLKSILSALWNLSAHCSKNKMDICAVEGALAFLVDMLSFNAPSKTLAIVENAGGILRNVSSLIAVRDDYRAIVRERGCLQVLLRQLRSPSLTVVSNACGALWNLSARCPQDQLILWDLGAVPMLRSLVHSKHKMISMGSSAALKNLLSARPNGSNIVHLDSTAKGLGLSVLPSLTARRQKAFEQEIDPCLSETCDNIEPSISPINKGNKFNFQLDPSFLDASNEIGQCLKSNIHPTVAELPCFTNTKPSFSRSENRKSMKLVSSSQSDTSFEKVYCHSSNGVAPLDSKTNNQSTSMYSTVNLNHSSSGNVEKKYQLRYMNAIPESLKPGEPLPDFRGFKCLDSTASWATIPHPSQNVNYYKPSLSTSTDDKMSLYNSTDSSSVSCSGQKEKSSTFNNIMNCNLFSTDMRKTASTLQNPTTDNIDVIFKDYSFNEDKQNSAYLTDIKQDKTSIEIYCPDSSCPSSGNFSASELNKEVTNKSHLKNISDSVSKCFPGQSLKFGFQNMTVNSTADSYPPTENLSPLGEERYPYSHKFKEVSAFFVDKTNYKDDMKSDKNFEKLKTNSSSSDIKEVHHSENKNQDELIELLGQQQVKDEDLSKKTYTDDNDYFTAQETYTIESNKKCDFKMNQEDDCTISQTLNHISVGDIALQIGFNQYEKINKTAENVYIINPKNSNTFDYNRKSNYLAYGKIKESDINNSNKLSKEASKKNQSFNDVNDITKSTLFSAEDYGEPKSLNTQRVEKSQEEYYKQRDPDAMIASLDRLTATLVQQSEAMRKRDLNAMKASILSTDTWNEYSPNDISFPSISGSVPLIPSFKSDVDDDIGSINELAEGLNLLHMTDSKIIEREAIKLAEAVSAEVNQVSLTSPDLDAINPPSNMGSLLSLTLSTGVSIDNGNSLEKEICELSDPLSKQVFQRKKSLPVGVVARRALGQVQSCTTASLENFLNECNVNNHSQLENVKPPSIMDELLDGADFENSLLSVASINSEITNNIDIQSFTANDEAVDIIKPTSNLSSVSYERYSEMYDGGSNTLTECLDNINPPSLFKEVIQIDVNSKLKDTLCIEENFNKEYDSHIIFDEQINEIAYETDEAVTPISSEYCSSNEITPKKRLNKNRSGHLTPKQKRQLVKERYKTYTIAAGRVKKEDPKKRELINESTTRNLTNQFLSNSKITSKQRRQEDRARFQTQVLHKPAIKKTNDNDGFIEQIAKIPKKTGIPTFRKFDTRNSNFKVNKFNDQEKNNEFHTILNLKNRKLDNLTITHVQEKVDDNSMFFILKTDCRDTFSECKNVSFDCEEEISSFHTNTVNEVEAKLFNINSKKLANLCETEMNHTSENLKESQSENSDFEKEEKFIVKGSGPRILKPNGSSRDSSIESHSTEKLEFEIPKGIRGRRKPLYSKINMRNSTLQCSPVKQVNSVTPITQSNSFPMVRATRTQTLRQHNSLQKTNTYEAAVAAAVNSPKKSSINSKRCSIPQKSSYAVFGLNAKQFSDNLSKIVSPVKPLERQGTFTKDEPEMENTHMVIPSTHSKEKYFSAKASPKTSPVNRKLKTLLNPTQRVGLVESMKLKKIASADKISVTKGIPVMAKRTTTDINSQALKSSPNGQLVFSSESGIPRKISVRQRSNSNFSIISTSSVQGSHNKLVKEATSKIASLWKKVEENKKQQKLEKPVGKKWILPLPESTMIEVTHGKAVKTSDLFRSSTFESVTKAAENSNQNFISSTEITSI